MWKDLEVQMDSTCSGKCLLCAGYYDKHLGHSVAIQTIK